jgi:hypothetical protein
VHTLLQTGSEEVPEVGIVASGRIGIEDQSLEQPNHVLREDGQLAGIEMIKIDRKVHEDLRCHQRRSGDGDERATASGIADERQLRIFSQVSDAVEDNLDNRVEWVVDFQQGLCELRHKPVGDLGGDCLEQGPVSGKISIHRLAGHVQSVGDLGEISTDSVALHALGGRPDDAIDGFLVGLWGLATPAMGAHKENIGEYDDHC